MKATLFLILIFFIERGENGYNEESFLLLNRDEDWGEDGRVTENASKHKT